MSEESYTCRVCEKVANQLGTYSPYEDFEVKVYNCEFCGSRLAPHDSSVYDKLHQSASSYSGHHVMAGECQKLFVEGKEVELRKLLSRVAKFKFIIDEVDALSSTSLRIMEAGCSSGSLGSWFILQGHNYMGIDVSEKAIEIAGNAFGVDNFVELSDWQGRSSEQFDVIFHAGTIGCVDDPIGMTLEFLERLRPGGLLVFNAPNVDACCRPEQLWVDGTHPPDLVTLFRPAFWKERFGDLAEVETTVLFHKGWPALQLNRKLARKQPWRWMPNQWLFGNSQEESASPLGAGIVEKCCDRLFGKIFNKLFPGLFDGRYPTDFGVLVIMRKRSVTS